MLRSPFGARTSDPGRHRSLGRAGHAVAEAVQDLPGRLLPGRVSRGVRVALAIMFGALVLGVHVLRIRAAGSERDATDRPGKRL